MKVAITNLGTIVSGDWRAPFVKGDTIITQDGRIAAVGTASAAEVEACRRRDRRRRHDRDSRSDRFPRSHHLRRLHAAPAHGRLSRKLFARRRDDVDLGFRSARARPAARCRRGESAGIGGAALLCGLSSRRHARDRGLGHSRAGTKGRGFHRTRSQRRRPGQGRLWRGEDRLRLRAAGRCCQGGRHDHHLPHRRLVHPRLRCDHRRSSVEDASARLVSHQRRTDRDAGSRTSSA